MIPNFMPNAAPDDENDYLHFEVLREKLHILCRAKATDTVAQIKNVVQFVREIVPDSQTLKMKGPQGNWVDIDEAKTLHDLGFSHRNATVTEPAELALLLEEDNGVVNIVPVPKSLTESATETIENEKGSAEN